MEREELLKEAFELIRNATDEQLKKALDMLAQSGSL